MAKTKTQTTTTTLESVPAGNLLDEILNRPPSQRLAAIDSWLEQNHAKIASLLPDEMKSHAERFCRVAARYIRTDERVANCTPASIVNCVLEAASRGFALDGRLVYAVAYNKKTKKDGKDVWESQAQCQFDYKAVIACAKRSGLIRDAWSRLVMPQDRIALKESNGVQTYVFEPELGIPRDQAHNAVGVLSVVVMPDGRSRWDWMPIQDVLAIRNRSQSYKTGYGPWVSDPGEMSRKTGIRRILKPITDDPGMAAMLTEFDMDLDNEVEAPKQSLADKLRERASRAEPVGVVDHVGKFPSQEEMMAADDSDQAIAKEHEVADVSWELAAEFEQALADAKTKAQVEAVRDHFSTDAEESVVAAVGMECDDRIKELSAKKKPKTKDELFEKGHEHP